MQNDVNKEVGMNCKFVVTVVTRFAGLLLVD